MYSVTISIATYAYIGVEIMAVTASEARNPTRSLSRLTKFIAYLTASVYIFSFIFFYLGAEWHNNYLPSIYGPIAHPTLLFSPAFNTTTKSNSTLVIVAADGDISLLPNILIMFLVVVILSTANTGLYVSSRTLYGLTRNANPNSPYWWERGINKLSNTARKRNIPEWALSASAGIFCWVLVLCLSMGFSYQVVCS
jgi:yeast amino acid transporter